MAAGQAQNLQDLLEFLKTELEHNLFPLGVDSAEACIHSLKLVKERLTEMESYFNKYEESNDF